MAFSGPLVFYLFGHSVINSVIWFSIYLVLRIWSNGLAFRKDAPGMDGGLDDDSMSFDKAPSLT